MPSLSKVLFYVEIFLVMFFGAFFPVSVFASDGWYNHDWGYRKEITIDHTKVPSSDNANFPVLITITDPDIMAHAQSDGHDILFTDATGITKISYEREAYNAGTGGLVAWVHVANLSHLTDTTIYMYYGNSVASDQSDTTGATWDTHFKGVWHLNDPTDPRDATANGNNGANNGVTGTTGQIGGAGSFDGIDNYIGIVPSGTLSGSYTISIWANVADGDGGHTVIGTRNDGDYTFDFKFDIGDANNIHGDIGDGNDWLTTNADVDTSVFSYAIDTWYHITYVVTPTGFTIYIDGNEVANENFGDANPLLFDATHNLFIGQVGYDDEWFHGVIDEVRVSNTARSADWIQTEYNNQHSPSTFYQVGNETNMDDVSPTVPGVPKATIGTNVTTQVWNWTASTDSGSGLSHYHWQVDGGASGTTDFPTVTTNLPIGNWKFHVKAEDYIGNQSTAQSALLSILSSSISQVTIDNSVPIAWIIAPDGISDLMIDLAPITVVNGDVLEAGINTDLYIKTLLSTAVVTVYIPAGAVIKGASSLWSNKIIIPPVVTSVTIPAPAGFRSQIALAILMGHNIAPLDITKGVRILIEGQSGKRVGHVSDDVFTEITSICSDNTQAVGDALAAGQNCKINSGTDLVIWTKHFSKFVTYDLVATETNASSSTNNAPSAPGCTAAVTSGTPDLFEIRMNDTTATLNFAPPSMPYSSFYVAYSRKPDVWEYGTEFTQGYSGGVIKQTINLLQPNTTYYFKVRAGNGCATGNWGNMMKATTTASTAKNRVFYKNIFAAIWQKTIQKIVPEKNESEESLNSISTASTANMVQTNTVSPTPTPIVAETQAKELPPTKRKFCILWWCF